MGFWGSLVAARTDQPLEGMLEQAGLGDDFLDSSELGDGWQLGRVGGIPADLTAAVIYLAVTTEAPVVAAVVLDSDCGPVASATASGDRWQGTLGKTNAVTSYDMPDDGVSAEAEADALQVWATSADLSPDRDVLVEALAPDTSDAVQSLMTLLRGLGIST